MERKGIKLPEEGVPHIVHSTEHVSHVSKWFRSKVRLIDTGLISSIYRGRMVGSTGRSKKNYL
jgi:hypothetical protein